MRDDDTDPRELAARILRPARPRLAEARAAVEGLSDPREAWEVLGARGLLPRENAARAFLAWRRRVLVVTDYDEFELASRFVATPSGTPRDPASTPVDPAPSNDPYGAFRVTELRGDAVEFRSRADMDLGSRVLIDAPELTATPPSVAACVALASDPEGVATAEALAGELWLQGAGRGVAWTFERSDRVEKRRARLERQWTGAPPGPPLSDRDARSRSAERAIVALGYATWDDVSVHDSVVLLALECDAP